MKKHHRMIRTNLAATIGQLFVLMFLLPALFSACDKEKEPIPGYLKIPSFQVEATDPSLTGSIGHKITHARISLIDPVDSTTQLIGMFELPATIPVLAEGTQILSIDPVIKANGNSFYLQPYPFYERYYGTVQFTPTEDAVVVPVTQYVADAKFDFIEDFEGSQHLFGYNLDGNDSTFVSISKDDVREGAFSGKISLDTTNYYMSAATDSYYILDYATAGRVFLEVDYKNEVPIEFGLVAVDNTGTLVPNFEFVVLPKSEWNKIYFDLTDLVRTAASVDKFFIAFQTYIPIQNGQLTLDKANVYLDNIKLITF
ncbi:MAG: hypothetical protein R2830_23360 [Saprospiraceae bacterium]